MNKALLTAALLAACGMAMAKLPPPDEAAKAKAAEAKAKADWQAKVNAYQLCKAQDRVVAHYRKTVGSAPAGAGKNGKHAAGAQGGTPPAMPVAGTAPAAASQPSSAGTTPVAAVAPKPCADPGPFAYTPPEQKPLEAAGAHSPAATAVSPPTTGRPDAASNPVQKK